MKKIILILFLIGGLFSFKATVDEEGMFPMSKLSSLDLKKAGLEIEVDEIYNESKPALVNALVRLGGCTGSFISETGLIITNHHCVFSSVASASSSENNYLENGFYAADESSEIKTTLPCKITQSYTDVSDKIVGGFTKSMSALDKKKLIKKNREAVIASEKLIFPNLAIEISEMLVGKKYTLFRYKTLNDVRLVYVPPKNIGKFGGETDNWEWPRHNGDFSVVRAYENGVPYKPESHLEVNPSGTKEGDFTFILGYPGRTYRNQTAQFLDYQNNYILPIISNWFDFKIEAIENYAGDDVDMQLRYSGKLASLSNVTKNFKGKMQGLRRTDVIASTYKDQDYLKEYAQNNPDLKSYVPLFSKNKKLYDKKYQLTTDYLYLNQLYGTGVFSAASSIASLNIRFEGFSKAEKNEYLDSNSKRVNNSLGSYYSMGNDGILDRKFFVELFYRISQSKITQVSSIFSNRIENFTKKGITEYADKLWLDSKLTESANGAFLFKRNPLKFLKNKSEMIGFASEINDIFSAMQAEMNQINAEIDEIIPRFNDLELQLNGGNFIPDANGTLRFTYGYIKGYEPEDAVVLSPLTTVSGILEKAEGSENSDYYLQKKYIEKLKTIEPADVLRHPTNGSVVVGLLYNMDTTGGNSGSPIMDSKGRLVGVNFDRAYTATINDYAWNESYSRSIGVDIRYVLYVMKYFGEADKVLAEMGVVL